MCAARRFDPFDARNAELSRGEFHALHTASVDQLYAEAAANVAAGISTPTAQVTDVDETTRPRLSRWARRKQRGPVRPVVDEYGYDREGHYYAHLDGVENDER